MEFYEVESLKRQLARDIMRYLRLHPEVMEINHNREVYEYVRELRIRHAMKDGNNYEDVAFVVDEMCEHETRNVVLDFEIDQKILDCFRPNAVEDEKCFGEILSFLKARKSKR